MPLVQIRVFISGTVDRYKNRIHIFGDSATRTIPYSSIQIIQKFLSYLFQVGNTQFAGDEEMTNKIYVR